jgi:hypothetical protein
MTITVAKIKAQILEDIAYYNRELDNAYIDEYREQCRGQLMYADSLLDMIENDF